MGSSNENPKFSVACGGVYPTNEKGIEMPPEMAKAIKLWEMMLNGEMSITLDSYTGIREDDGEVKARLDNKNSSLKVSKKLIEKDSKKAVTKYMKEKSITTIEDVINSSKTVNFEEAKQNDTSKVSGEGR